MPHKFNLLLVLVLVSTAAYSSPFDNTQLTIRTGMIQGSYSSPFESGSEEEAPAGGNVESDLEGGGFSVMPSLDFSYEIFTETKKSYALRTTIALDMGTGTMHYNYFGISHNIYYKGIGMPIYSTGATGNYKIIPKTRSYYGYDIGMSRVSVLSFGPALAAVSTGIDFGGHWGYMRQMGKGWSLNAELGGSYAYGISTVSSAGMNIKILFGITLTP